MRIHESEEIRRSREYRRLGTFRELFLSDKRKYAHTGKSIWGYDIVKPLSVKVYNDRIEYMKTKMNEGIWEGRRRMYANMHLKNLISRLNILEGKDVGFKTTQDGELGERRWF